MTFATWCAPGSTSGRRRRNQNQRRMVHKDLDLVQRILRDQLSEDFTAIRVDSEEEYQGIVEFVNRIQPRMVRKSAALHSRRTYP